MQAENHKRLCQLGDISSWLHPLRRTAGYDSLNKAQQNRLLCVRHQLLLPPLEDIAEPPTSDFVNCWSALPRLCLMAGSLGLMGSIYAQRLQPLYQPADLALVTTLSQQCFPVSTHDAGNNLNEGLLSERGWLAICQAFNLSSELQRAGLLALPPSLTSCSIPLATSLRVCLALNKIRLYLQEAHGQHE
ncbi:hypothetical protein SC171_21645 [Pantoea cypripedii]|uniref:hypothetical protein n=1 Tax=Pantoea cypripedii TaxID=55209 RepID=UPI002FCC1D14